jgi:hypothetical protein
MWTDEREMAIAREGEAPAEPLRRLPGSARQEPPPPLLHRFCTISLQDAGTTHPLYPSDAVAVATISWAAAKRTT